MKITKKIKNKAKYDKVNIWYNENKIIHRDNDLPAKIYYKNKTIVKQIWYQNGYKHRDIDLPAEIYDYKDKIYKEVWYRNGIRHRDGDLPAYTKIVMFPTDHISFYKWYKNGMLHRYDDKPAVMIETNNTSGNNTRSHYWYINNKKDVTTIYLQLYKLKMIL